VGGMAGQPASFPRAGENSTNLCKSQRWEEAMVLCSEKYGAINEAFGRFNPRRLHQGGLSIQGTGRRRSVPTQVALTERAAQYGRGGA